MPHAHTRVYSIPPPMTDWRTLCGPLSLENPRASVTMTNKREKQKKPDTLEEQSRKRESGLPGGGQGRVDEVGPTGIYPMSAGLPEGRHPEIRTPASWGQGERGAEGYNDAGGSELVWRDGQLLGGLTAGPGGEPTIDIHGGDRLPTPGNQSNQGGAESSPPTSQKAARKRRRP